MRELEESFRDEVWSVFSSAVYSMLGVYLCAAMTPVPTALDSQLQEIKFGMQQAYRAAQEIVEYQP
ncbi:MAG: hypothetical protein ABIH72_04500 [archaeon]